MSGIKLENLSAVAVGESSAPIEGKSDTQVCLGTVSPFIFL